MDTTSLTLSGEYLPDSEENSIKVVAGYSKDHRPDLKQVVLEMMVSQDGGLPFISKSWDGNTSDNEVFKERCKTLVAEFAKADGPKVLFADSKFYSESNAENLKNLAFATRIPESIKLAKDMIDKALNVRIDNWSQFDDQRRYVSFDLKHYEIQQRWIVVYSTAAMERVKKTTIR